MEFLLLLFSRNARRAAALQLATDFVVRWAYMAYELNLVDFPSRGSQRTPRPGHGKAQ